MEWILSITIYLYAVPFPVKSHAWKENEKKKKHKHHSQAKRRYTFFSPKPTAPSGGTQSTYLGSVFKMPSRAMSSIAVVISWRNLLSPRKSSPKRLFMLSNSAGLVPPARALA